LYYLTVPDMRGTLGTIKTIMDKALMSYTKLFHQILTSSIWDEDDFTVRIWFTLMASTNRQGEVLATVRALARAAGKDWKDDGVVAQVAAAIEKFKGPDLESRTKDNEGRRIEEIDGGWRLLNFEKYREMMNEEYRRDYWAQAKAKQRAKEKADTGPGSLSQQIFDRETDEGKNPDMNEIMERLKNESQNFGTISDAEGAVQGAGEAHD
jgi:hypothetical protein